MREYRIIHKEFNTPIDMWGEVHLVTTKWAEVQKWLRTKPITYAYVVITPKSKPYSRDIYAMGDIVAGMTVSELKEHLQRRFWGHPILDEIGFGL